MLFRYFDNNGSIHAAHAVEASQGVAVVFIVGRSGLAIECDDPVETGFFSIFQGQVFLS